MSRELLTIAAALARIGSTLRPFMLGALVLGLAAGVSAEEESSDETCLACHGLEDFSGPADEPLFVDPASFADSSHAPLPCTTCHMDATDIPHAERPVRAGVETCSMCHGEVVAAYGQSVHGKNQRGGNGDAATCTNCHGSPHYVKKATDPASMVYPLRLPRTCGVCHADLELAERNDIRVVGAYQMYMDSIHGRALTRSGLLVAANCSSCHGSHGIRPSEDPDSRVFRANVPSTCGTCHAGVEEAYFEGSHGQALEGGSSAAPVCVTCHTAHQIARVDTDPWKLRVVGVCGNCHEESRRTYGDTFHGQVTALGFTAVARCSDCHGAHRVFPASDVRSSVAPENLVTTCRKCHPQANQNFVLYSPHADSDDKERNPLLYYVAHLMDFLIVGVFIFFGLHTILWLLRSIRVGHEPEATPLDQTGSDDGSR